MIAKTAMNELGILSPRWERRAGRLFDRGRVALPIICSYQPRIDRRLGGRD